MLVLILASLWIGLYQVVKQQGRILLRLDQLEPQRSAASPQADPAGLPVGTAFPSFRLSDLSGRIVQLEELRPKQVFLVHWNPECGFCEMITGELAGLQQDLSKQNIQMLLLAHGSAAANRQLAEAHGLCCPILLLDGNPPVEPLQHMGTPMAYLLDREGRV